MTDARLSQSKWFSAEGAWGPWGHPAASGERTAQRMAQRSGGPKR